MKYEEMSAEEIAAIQTNGTFEERLELEIQAQDKTRGFLIWKKPENVPTEQNKRSKPRDHVFVQHLDHCHSTIESVNRNIGVFGMTLVHSHIPESNDPETLERHEPIRAFVAGHSRLREAVKKELMAEMGVAEKIAQKSKPSKGE